jgi:hypothetical protein
MSLGVINHGMSLSVPIYIWTHPIWPLWFSFFMWWISSWGETHKFWRGPFNEYSYQVWFQFTQWFHRGRMKCKRLRTMTNRHKMMTKSHMNHWVRGKLKKERKSHICVNLLWRTVFCINLLMLILDTSFFMFMNKMTHKIGFGILWWQKNVFTKK